MLLLPTMIEEVAVGDELLEPVYTLDGRLLLEARTKIGEKSLSRLKKEGIVRVLVEPANPETGTNLYSQTNLLDHCEMCGNGFALRQPRGQCYCKPFQCTQCQSTYFGAFDYQCSGAFCGPERVFCDRNTCSHMCDVHLSAQQAATHFNADCLSSIAKEIISGAYTGPERRRAKRHEVDAFVVVIPLSEAYRVVEKPRLAHTRDISASGVSLVSDRSFDAAACVVDFHPAGFAKLRFVANLVWEAKRGPIWQIGAAICGRVDPTVGDLAEIGNDLDS